MPDFTKLWDSKYLFGLNSAVLTRSDWIFLYAAAGFVVAAVVAKILAVRKEPASPLRFLLNRAFHLFLTTGLLSLLWVGFRYENIPWLSTHIVVLAIWFIDLVWAAYIVKYYFQVYPGRRKAWEEEKIKKKYLPH